LREFKEFLKKPEERVFTELVFCICTPQSKATSCWNAIKTLTDNGLLFKGNVGQISRSLKGVRFPHNKAKYIIEARKTFTTDNKIVIKKLLKSFSKPEELRDWLVKNVKGIGLKEASHFIRNIGLSNNQLAILDRHILNALKSLHVIGSPPSSLSRKVYESIETKMKEFSEQIGIPLDALDLLMWSEKTGFVFK
jgi:N-glycosylase/DNA lyase